MSRLIKWILVIVVVLVGIYASLIAVTGSQVRSIAEQQVTHYAEQNPDLNVELDWHDTGFRRSVGELRLTADIEGEPFVFAHSVILTHGALRATIEGEARASLGGDSFIDLLYGGEPLTLQGRVGMGGVTLSYQVPALQFDDEQLQMGYRVAPFEFTLVLREQDQHSHAHIEWAEMSATVVDATDVIRVEDMTFSSHTRLDAAGGQFEHGVSRFDMGSLVVGDYVDVLAAVHNLGTEIEAKRDGDLVRADGQLAVANYDVYGVSGELDLVFNLSNLPYSGFRHWQMHSDDEQAVEQLLIDMQQQQTRLGIERLQLTMGEMGNVLAQGQFELRDNIEFNAQQNLDVLTDMVQGQLVVEDLPLLLLMPLSGIVSDELPWTIELNDGNILINGDALELP